MQYSKPNSKSIFDSYFCNQFFDNNFKVVIYSQSLQFVSVIAHSNFQNNSCRQNT